MSAGSVFAQIDVGSVAGTLTPLETAKPWSISASVRGFYDDNYLTLPKNFPARGDHPLSSWGSEVTPAGTFNHMAENTLVTASYVYDMQWYDNGSNTIFQTHQFNGHAEHQFSDRYKLSVTDSFVVAQEPDVLASSGGVTAGIPNSPVRVSGSNIRNSGQVDFSAALTKLFDMHLGYANNYYRYQQDDKSVVGYPFLPPAYAGLPVPSYQGLLNRMEQLATLDLRWKATPETTGILGYQFGDTQYQTKDYIIYPYGPAYNYNIPAGGVASSGAFSFVRNSESQFLFVGLDQSVTSQLNISVRLGGEYIDYYNDRTSRVSPYVDASLTYQYLPGDSLQFGVKHVHNATDVAGFIGPTAAQPVLDEESTAIYISDSHKFTDRLTGSVMGQAQTSTFVGGGAGFNGQSEQFYLVQLNLAYHFNPWFMIETGYNYSKLNTDLNLRAYTRDVMYLGLRAIY
ncbi:MAG TPA: outer membrane beta-barrel protein [Verrucomicrobiae bacterium]